MNDGHLGLLEKDGYPEIHERLCEVDDIFPGGGQRVNQQNDLKLFCPHIFLVQIVQFCTVSIDCNIETSQSNGERGKRKQSEIEGTELDNLTATSCC